MGETLGEAQGFRSWPAGTTGDLVIERPDGTRFVTRFGDGNDVLEREVQNARSKFDQLGRGVLR